MISYTVKHTELSIPERYKTAFDRLVERSEKKGGYLTVTISLPRKSGTDEQNSAFHALLNEYYVSRLHSYACQEDMRDSFKLRAGGAKEYIYLLNRKQHTCKFMDDIPQGCIWAGIPKSWTEFTRDERTMAIQLLMTEAEEAGINSVHWGQIIDGMEKE